MIRESVIQQIRAKGIKQVDLCRTLGFQVANLNAFLHGKRGMPFKDLCLLMQHIGVSFGMRDRSETSFPPNAVHKLAASVVESKNIKTGDLARISKVSASSVSSFLTGERPLSINNLEIICRYLNIGITQYTK